MVVVEAEKAVDGKAEVFRDNRASGSKTAGLMLTDGLAPFLVTKPSFPAGDYMATFHLEAVPVDILHHLEVVLSVGDADITLNQANFNSVPGYQPFSMAFFHKGGPLTIQVKAAGGSGFDGMRSGISEQEKEGVGQVDMSALDAMDTESKDVSFDDALSLLEDEKDVASLSPLDYRLLCDSIEIQQIRPAPVMVSRVEVDKIHYLPGETVSGAADISPGTESGAFTFVVEDITELDNAREVFRQSVELLEPSTINFDFIMDNREFGHEIRCSLLDGDNVMHSKSEFFGVSSNFYRIGITGRPGPQDTQSLTQERAAEIMRQNKESYANYFERFAWAPCDYSVLAPEKENFWSGQVQYPGSITGMSTLISEGHKVGVKAVTYGKACGAGIAGFQTFQRHPEYFGHSIRGTASEAMNVFFLERMLAEEYFTGTEYRWQHWPSLWCNFTTQAVEFGAQAVIDSIEMFGWDGIRWDGHFTNIQQPFIDMLRAKYPEFAHGYNTMSARPENDMFMPGDTNDFHTVAADHGLMMDESIRDWSHSNFSPGHIRPYYSAMCRQADYVKRVGGLPLFIIFDMASRQDSMFNALFGLAAGHRYTYATSLGNFEFGMMSKFLTRYSAFIWDDTRRVANAESIISVEVNGMPSTEPWWQESVWLRNMPDGKQQVLIHMVNPPGYQQFVARVQTPATTLTNLTVRLKIPEGAELGRVFHVSPDLVEGHETLEAVKDGDEYLVALDRVRLWSIVGYDLVNAPDPAYTLTTPVEDVAAVLAEQAEEEMRKQREANAKAGIAPSAEEETQNVQYASYYASTENKDLDFEQKMEKPDSLDIVRNGVMDIHHARGAFSWLNPVESAAALMPSATYMPSWVAFVGFKLRDAGCMDEFPDSYDQLMGYDVLVLDNIQARHLGTKRRVMAADFVRNGGGLLVFGGYWNISLGADHNTYIEELLPVTIAGFKQIIQNNDGLELKPEKPEFFENIDWSKGLQAFTVDVSPLKEGVEVLATVGGKPAIVAGTYGKGRVITVLMNPHGDYGPDARPYWLSPDWPRIIGSCLKWLGAGSEDKVDTIVKVKKTDPSKIMPDELAMESLLLDSKEFTAKLKEARVNMVDAESARILLETAVDNADKIDDMSILSSIVDDASPYFNKDMASLGEKLSKSDLDFIRRAGFRILGFAGDPKYRMILEHALRDVSADNVREALIGLGRIGDPEAIEAVRRHLESKSAQRQLALSVLVKLGDKSVLKDALAAYEEGLEERIKLKCKRLKIHDTLWGATSFKLTPERRREIRKDYYAHLRREAAARFNLEYFSDTLRNLTEEDLEVVVRFLASTERSEMLPVAYAIFSRMTPEKAAELKPLLENAKLEALRQMSQS